MILFYFFCGIQQKPYKICVLIIYNYYTFLYNVEITEFLKIFADTYIEVNLFSAYERSFGFDFEFSFRAEYLADRLHFKHFLTIWAREKQLWWLMKIYMLLKWQLKDYITLTLLRWGIYYWWGIWYCDITDTTKQYFWAKKHSAKHLILNVYIIRTSFISLMHMILSWWAIWYYIYHYITVGSEIIFLSVKQLYFKKLNFETNLI